MPPTRASRSTARRPPAPPSPAIEQPVHRTRPPSAIETHVAHAFFEEPPREQTIACVARLERIRVVRARERVHVRRPLATGRRLPVPRAVSAPRVRRPQCAPATRCCRDALPRGRHSPARATPAWPLPPPLKSTRGGRGCGAVGAPRAPQPDVAPAIIRCPSSPTRLAARRGCPATRPRSAGFPCAGRGRDGSTPRRSETLRA